MYTGPVSLDRTRADRVGAVLTVVGRFNRSEERAVRLGFRIFAMTALVALAVVLAACGSSSSDSSGSNSSGLSAEGQKALALAYKGTFSQPPSSGPKPQ